MIHVQCLEDCKLVLCVYAKMTQSDEVCVTKVVTAGHDLCCSLVL